MSINLTKHTINVYTKALNSPNYDFDDESIRYIRNIIEQCQLLLQHMETNQLNYEAPKQVKQKSKINPVNRNMFEVLQLDPDTPQQEDIDEPQEIQHDKSRQSAVQHSPRMIRQNNLILKALEKQDAWHVPEPDEKIDTEELQKPKELEDQNLSRSKSVGYESPDPSYMYVNSDSIVHQLNQSQKILNANSQLYNQQNSIDQNGQSPQKVHSRVPSVQFNTDSMDTKKQVDKNIPLNVPSQPPTAKNPLDNSERSIKQNQICYIKTFTTPGLQVLDYLNKRVLAYMELIHGNNDPFMCKFEDQWYFISPDGWLYEYTNEYKTELKLLVRNGKFIKMNIMKMT